MRRSVTVHIEDGNAAPRLLATLGQLTGVAFASTGPHEARLQVVDTPFPRTPELEESAATLQCAGIMVDADGRRTERVAVQFANDASVPWPFRGRNVSTTIPPNCAPLLPIEGERVLASTQSGALWLVRTVAGRVHFRSAMPLLEIPSNGSFAQVFSGSSFLANLPLMHLLAQFSSTGIGVRQTLRASFMFDDPNLHWSSYGYVNYARLLKSADQENFHVSFATIPLDSWYVHEKTANKFRENRQRLSLLVHGNNHTRHELARESSPLGCSALLQQAQRRIGKLETRANLFIDRVMVPPHGACSASMLAALPGEGFEGACISAGSLSAHNPGAEWIRALGLRPAEQILGCPVLPRWALAGVEDSELLVAAYLGRPLILRGHHGDLRDGIDVLANKARFINGLGDVQWRNNTALLRSSYQLNMIGSIAYLRVFSRKVIAAIPSFATALVIEPPELNATGERFFVSGLGPKQLESLPYQAIPMPKGKEETTIEITYSIIVARSDPVAARGFDASSVLRRLLTELRDRLMPLAN